MTTIEEREESRTTEIRQFRFSRHALEEIERRQIPRDTNRVNFGHPQQIVEEMEGLKAISRKLTSEPGGCIY